MSQVNDGGSAFPSAGLALSEGITFERMSLRDYFAAKAMQAILGAIMTSRDARECVAEVAGCSIKVNASSTTAELAYEQADAMLKAREAE